MTEWPGETVGELLADPERARKLAANGREVIRSRQGATQRHAQLLGRLLGLEPEPGGQATGASAVPRPAR